jgi:hypothetical protein
MVIEKWFRQGTRKEGGNTLKLLIDSHFSNFFSVYHLFGHKLAGFCEDSYRLFITDTFQLISEVK